MSLYRILFHSIEAQPLIKRTEIVSSIVLQRGKFLYTFSYLKSDISPCILLAVSCEKPAYHSAQSHLWPLPPQKWPSIAASRDAILNLANILFYIRRRLNVLSVPFALSKRNLKLELCFSKSYLKEYITLCFFFSERYQYQMWMLHCILRIHAVTNLICVVHCFIYVVYWVCNVQFQFSGDMNPTNLAIAFHCTRKFVSIEYLRLPVYIVQLTSQIWTFWSSGRETKTSFTSLPNIWEVLVGVS